MFFATKQFVYPLGETNDVIVNLNSIVSAYASDSAEGGVLVVMANDDTLHLSTSLAELWMALNPRPNHPYAGSSRPGYPPTPEEKAAFQGSNPFRPSTD